ncbi:hypothetical protein [Aquimarina sp. 433]
MKRKLIFFSLILIITSFKVVKKDIWIWFPKEIGIVENCIGREVETTIEIKTDSRRKVEIHSFKLSGQNFHMTSENQIIEPSDTIILTRKKPLLLKLRYNIESKLDYSLFKFKTNNEKYNNNTVKISYGVLQIKSDQIKDRKEHIIDISNNCKDNIKLAFPYGGTVSSVAIYRDSTIIKKPIKTTSYMMMDDNNYVDFSKSEIGRYYVEFGACHWRSDFWITIK